MPVILPFLVSAVGSFLVAEGVISVGVAFFATFATSLVVNAYEKRRAESAARDAYNKSLKDRTIMTATTDKARSIVYGEARTVDGVLFKATHGVNKEFYTLVIALAGHEVDSIGRVFFDDIPLQLDVSGNVQTAPYARSDLLTQEQFLTLDGFGNGSAVLPLSFVAGSVAVFTVPVSSPDSPPSPQPAAFTMSFNVCFVADPTYAFQPVRVVYQSAETSTPYAKVTKHTGAPGQDLSQELSLLVPDLITAGVHRFEGIACLLVTLTFNADVYVKGVPNISAVVRGKKLFDPRTGVTQWADPHPNGITHPGRNPALIALDWAQNPYGGDLDLDEITVESFTQAANDCDVETTFPSRLLGGDQDFFIISPRYEGDIVAPTDVGPDRIFADIIAAMAGSYGWGGGLLRVRAGAWHVPVVLLNEDWISDAGAIEISPSTSAQDTINIIRPSISDKDRNYVVAPVPEVRSDPYIVVDGQELPLEIQFIGVTQPHHAADLSTVMLLESRQALTVSLPCKLHAFRMELFDTLYVELFQYGWFGKTFEVLGWSFTMEGGVQLKLRESRAATFDINTTFLLNDLQDNTSLPKPWIVAPITGLAVSSVAEIGPDLQIVTRTLATWNKVVEAQVALTGAVEIQWIEIGGVGQSSIQWVNYGSFTGNAAIPGVAIPGLAVPGTGQDSPSSAIAGIAVAGEAVAGVGATSSVQHVVQWINDNGDIVEWINSTSTTTTTGFLSGWNTRTEAGSSTSTLVVGLKVGSAYIFRARAVNSLGVHSSWSTHVSIIIPNVGTQNVSQQTFATFLIPSLPITGLVSAQVGTYPGVLGSPGWTYVDTLSFTALETGDYFFFVQGTLDFTTGDGSTADDKTAYLVVDIDLNNNLLMEPHPLGISVVTTNWPLASSAYVGPPVNGTFPFSISRVIPVVYGTSYVFPIYAAIRSSSATSVLKNFIAWVQGPAH